MKREIFRRKIVMMSIFLFPFMAIGIGLIGYQTYNIISGKGYQSLSFNISDLWKSLNPSEGLDIFTNTNNNQSIFASLPLSSSSNSIIPKRNTPLLPTFISSKQTELFKSDLINTKNKISASAFLGQKEKFLINPINELNFSRQIIFQKYLNQINKEHFLTTEIRPNQRKFYIGISYSHLRAFRNLTYRQIQTEGITYEDGTRYIVGQTEGFRNQTDRQTALGGLSFDLGYQISPKLTIQSGISIRRMGEQIEILSDLSQFQGEVQNIEHQFVGLSPEIVQQPGDLFFNNTYSYFDIPLQIQYTIKEYPRSSLRIMSHITPRWMFGTSSMVYDFERDYYILHTDGKDEIFNNFNVSVGGGIVFTHMVSTNFDIQISPFFEQNLRSTFSRDYTIKQINYATGLNIGLRYYIPEKTNANEKITEVL